MGGRTYERIVGAAGEPRLVPLDRRLVQRPDDGGTTRFVHLVRIPRQQNRHHGDVTIAPPASSKPPDVPGRSSARSPATGPPKASRCGPNG